MTETEMKTTIALDPETDRTFHFRITSKHDQEDTKTKDLTIDALIDGDNFIQAALYDDVHFK